MLTLLTRLITSPADAWERIRQDAESPLGASCRLMLLWP